MKLEQIRNKKGMTQTDLDVAAGLVRGTVNDIDNRPSWEIVKRLSDALGVKPEKLFPVNVNITN